VLDGVNTKGRVSYHREPSHARGKMISCAGHFVLEREEIFEGLDFKDEYL